MFKWLPSSILTTMKKLAFLIIVAGFGLSGSHFFGFYTAPGLEGFPTVESLGQERNQARARKAEEISGGKPSGARPSGPIKANKNGAMSQRNNYLNQNKGKVTGQ